MKKILVTGKSLVPEQLIADLKNRNFDVKHVKNDVLTNDELTAELENIHAYIVGGYEEPSDDVFAKANDLEIVVWPGTDYKPYIPGWRYAQEKGIAFVTAQGANANSVAEMTIGLIIMGIKRLGIRFATLQDDEPYSGSGSDLLGKTVGIIGMGRIGTRVAEILKLGFNTNVIYTSRTRKHSLEEKLGIKWVTDDELFAVSDIISVHRPGLNDNEPVVISTNEISMMNKQPLLINTVKWNLFDIDAITQGINNNKISCVAFDGNGSGEAWEKLVSLGQEEVLWIPQCGFNTIDANFRASKIAIDAMLDLFDGKDNPNLANPDFLDKRGM